MEARDMILVRTSDVALTRGFSPKELSVEVLANNLNVFLGQVRVILEKTPDQLGTFRFAEFEVAAEISADGKLILLGSGVEVGAKASLTFKFRR